MYFDLKTESILLLHICGEAVLTALYKPTCHLSLPLVVSIQRNRLLQRSPARSENLLDGSKRLNLKKNSQINLFDAVANVFLCLCLKGLDEKLIAQPHTLCAFLFEICVCSVLYVVSILCVVQ